MRFVGALFIVLMCFSVSGCYNTTKGIKDDYYALINMNKKVMKPPSSNNGFVLQQPVTTGSNYNSYTAHDLSPPSNNMGHANSDHGSPVSYTQKPVMYSNANNGVSYNSGSVTVFPIDDASLSSCSNGHASGGRSYDYSNDVTGNAINDGSFAPIGSYSQPLKLPRKRINGDTGIYDNNAVYFKHGSSNLSGSDKSNVRKLAEQLKRTGQPVRITGHASNSVYTTKDPVQKDIINLHMGMKRAVAVTEELYRSGVKNIQVETVSKGDALSVGSDKEDRRVDIKY